MDFVDGFIGLTLIKGSDVDEMVITGSAMIYVVTTGWRLNFVENIN